MDSITTAQLKSQLGNLLLEVENGKLSALSIKQDSSRADKENTVENSLNAEQLENIQQQLACYFNAATPFSSLPLSPQGTDFQKSVWDALCKIPMGETRTYGEIANQLNSSARAVGNACRKNPIAIIVPCHRVVSANGIGGYAGETTGRQLDIKRWLLKHEGVSV